MLDHYLIGQVKRISPEAPVPILEVRETEFRLGGAANVANNIRGLEEEVVLVGVIGEDEYGKKLMEKCLNEGIITQLIEDKTRPTTLKTRLIGNHQQMIRYDIEKNEAVNADFRKIVKETIDTFPCEWIVLSDYNKGVFANKFSKEIIEFSKKHNKKVIIDPKTSRWSVYHGAFLVTPNFKEFCEAVGHSVEDTTEVIELYAKELIEKYQIENLLVTRSEKGMTLFTADHSVHFPSEAREVYDVTGAGDTVLAAIASFLNKGKSLENSIRIANIAAGKAVAKFGTQRVELTELEF